jgi:hypothetical protein
MLDEMVTARQVDKLNNAFVCYPVARIQRQARAKRPGCGRGGSAGGRGGFGYGGGFGFAISRVRKSHHDMTRHPVARIQRQARTPQLWADCLDQSGHSSESGSSSVPPPLPCKPLRYIWRRPIPKGGQHRRS